MNNSRYIEIYILIENDVATALQREFQHLKRELGMRVELLSKLRPLKIHYYALMSDKPS